MPASKDPKSYIKPCPLPIPSCSGMKLLARDTVNFNPEFPSREEVRKNNYNRRLNQMSVMGFRSPNHKPYIGIGDPFYLDERKMILHALGQWNEDQDSSSSSSDESDDDDDHRDTEPKQAFTAAKFVLRRSRKDLNTLNKAVVHGRNMIRNVSLGHGLFDLINKEKLSKKAASEEALRRRQELLRNEFQPPKAASDEETDDDLDNDVDLMNYMVPMAPPAFMTQLQTDTDEELGIISDHASESDQSPERQPDIVTFSGMALAEDEEEYLRNRSAAMTSALSTQYTHPVSRRKKKQETPRPYTPQHTNLSAKLSLRESQTDPEQEFDITKDALFRQLCVLHWILEAMSSDPPTAMSPIMSCWSLLDIGGSKTQPKKILKDKTTESNWATFLSKDSAKKVNIYPRVQVVNDNNTKVSKRLAAHKLTNKSPHVRRPLYAAHGRNSTQPSSTPSQQGSSTGLNMLNSQVTHLAARNRAEDTEQLSVTVEEEEDQMYRKSIFKFLDEYYESLKSEEEEKMKLEDTNKSQSPTPPTSPSPDKKDKKGKNKSKKKKDLETDERKLTHKVAVALGEEEKMSSRLLRANAHLIRPKSSPALIEFQCTRPSMKKVTLCAELHNQFAETREEKALTLHDILDDKESQRMNVCQTKFVSLQSLKQQGSSFYRAVKEMRANSWKRLQKPISERKSSAIKRNWYTDLEDKIPNELKQEWYYVTILQKLANFGLIEGTGKLSIYKFIKVLEGLREWEICSPDITAAIEFCREYIVKMSIEDYELWFTQRFPKISRPQTAPAVTKSEKKDDRFNSGTLTQQQKASRFTQSAFVHSIQH